MTNRPLDPAVAERVRAVFSHAPFIRLLGMTLESVEAGRVETRLVVADGHTQHHGFVHAGVQTTVADHACGCAATTLLPQGKAVLTAEFKMNFLRPARGKAVICRARVLKPGRALVVTEADVFAVAEGDETHVSRMLATMAVVDLPG